MPRLGLALAACGLALTSCTTEIVDQRVDPGAVDIEVGFLVQTEASAVRRLGPAFGLAPSPFGRPTFAQADPERPLFLVNLPHAALAAQVPGYDRAQLEGLRVDRLDPLQLDPLGSPAHVPLPEAAEVYAVDLQTGALRAVDRAPLVWLAEIGLYVPRDDKFCQASIGAIEAFGARPYLLDPPPFAVEDVEAAATIRDIAPLPDGRVLGLTYVALFVLSPKGEVASPSAPGPKLTLHRSELDGGRGVILQRMHAVPGGETFWISGRYGERGVLLRVTLGPAGLALEEMLFEDEDGGLLPVLRDVTVDGAGNVLAVGGAFEAILRPPSGGPPRRIVLPPAPTLDEDEKQLNVLTETEDPRAPHIIGVKGDAVLVGDFETGQFDFQYIRRSDERPLGVSPYLQELIVRGEERWAAGRGAMLARWEKSLGWVAHPLPANPRFDACTQGTDINGAGVHFVALEGDDAHIFTLASRCNAVIAYDRNLDCTAMIDLPTEVTETSEGTPLKVLRLDGERLYVAGERGRLFTVERP